MSRDILIFVIILVQACVRPIIGTYGTKEKNIELCNWSVKCNSNKAHSTCSNEKYRPHQRLTLLIGISNLPTTGWRRRGDCGRPLIVSKYLSISNSSKVMSESNIQT